MSETTITRREERKKTIKEIGSNPVITGTTEMYKMKVLSGMIEDLEDSINNHSRSTNCLSIILVIATVIIALVGIVDISFRVFVESSHHASQTSGKLNE